MSSMQLHNATRCSGLEAIVSCLRAEVRQQEGVVSCRDGCCSCACRVRCGLTAVKLSAVLLLATCCSQCPRRMCLVLHPTLHTPGDTVSVHHLCVWFKAVWLAVHVRYCLGVVANGRVPDAACRLIVFQSVTSLSIVSMKVHVTTVNVLGVHIGNHCRSCVGPVQAYQHMIDHQRCPQRFSQSAECPKRAQATLK